MHINERLETIRKYRRYEQEDFSAMFGNSQQAWSKRENEETAALGMPLRLIIEMMDKLDIDARYLFGQLESIESADLRLRSNANRDLTVELIDEVRELRKLRKPDPNIDPVFERLRINQPLYEICNLIKNLDGTLLQRIEDLIKGFMFAQEKPAIEDNIERGRAG